jgi:hypothetical protein
MAERGRAGHLRRRLIVVAVQLLAVVVLLELALRLASPWHDGLRQLLRRPTAADDYSQMNSVEELMGSTMLGFRPHVPIAGFVLNSRSLRTVEYDRQKPPGVLRVLAIGDSFTFASGGLPHPYHWPTILERMLSRRGNRPVEVLRFGVPDSGPAFQLRLWELEGARLGSDAVVVAFFVGNDFRDHQDALLTREISDWSLRRRLAHHSYAYRGLRNAIRLATGVESSPAAEPLIADDGSPRGGYELRGYRRKFNPSRPTFSERHYLRIESSRMRLCLVDRRDTFELLLRSVMTVLENFHRQVGEAGARFVLMVIPDEFQVDPELAERVWRKQGRKMRDYDLERPQRRLLEECEVRGIEMLDLLPAFRERATDGPLYRPRDTHWNHRGNRLAARLLADHLGGGRPSAKEPLVSTPAGTGQLPVPAGVETQ